MKKPLPSLVGVLWFNICIAAVFLMCASGHAKPADPRRLSVNQYGEPAIDARERHINYNRKSLEAMARAKDNWSGLRSRPAHSRAAGATATPRPRPTPKPRPTPQPPPVGTGPFWQYAIFGSDIGESNIVIGPVPQNGAPEIIIGGYSYSPFGDSPTGYSSDNFWQVIRYNPTTGNYDQVFVSRIYTDTDGNPFVDIARIGLAHVTSTSDSQIVVMLDDGRIYLYDFVSKAELGYLDTGISGLRALSLTDLDGDGRAELIATDDYDLYVFNGSGQLLWQVAEAGGSDVVAGRMDNGASPKIATTSGKVIDAATHQVVWTQENGFGRRLKLAPFPGENYQQLISAEAWNYVYSYDVGRQLPRWSINTPQDIGAIEVADVDSDGIPEVIVADGQWGSIHVYDLTSQALKWEVNNPGWGVTNIVVGNVDNADTTELLWAAASYAESLFVASTTGPHDIKWQSPQFRGPFVGPAIGDLDGDGQPELVICSQGSGLADSGRILVFDLGTLTLRAISAPVVDNHTAVGVNDLKLRDVIGDGRMEIVIASDYVYDGSIEIYRFDSNNTFTRLWTNATQPSGSPFNLVDVADLDNDGTVKIIGGNTVATTGSEGTYVYIYDYPSGTQSWRSVNLATDFSAVTGLVVEDLDANGSKEIAALIGTGDLYTWDGPTRQLQNLRQGTNGTRLSNRSSAAGLVLGDTSGVGHFLQWSNNNSYTEMFTRQLATDCDPYAYAPCLNGLNVTPDNSLWTGTGSMVNQRLAPSYDSVAWQSPEIGGGFGRFVATAVRNGQNCVFSSAQHAVVGLVIAPPASPTPTPNPRATPRPRPTPAPRP